MPVPTLMSPRRRHPWLLYVAPVLLIGAVLWGFKVADATRKTFNQDSAWPVVTATIIESRVVDRGGIERYCPFVRYAYDRAGTVYHASRIARDEESLCSRDKDTADRVVQTYPVDRRVQVHYDPIEPGRSVLELREPTWLQAFPQSAAIMIFVLFVLVVRQIVLSKSKRLSA